MTNITLLKESKEIMRQMRVTEYSSAWLCPIMKILQMRHADLNMSQATKVVRNMLQD